MSLLDLIEEIRERMDATKSPSNAQLKQELLALADILESLLKNSSIFHQQIAAAVAGQQKDIQELKNFASKTPKKSP